MEQATSFFHKSELIDSTPLSEFKETLDINTNTKEEMSVELLISIVYGLLQTLFVIFIVILAYKDPVNNFINYGISFWLLICFIVLISTIIIIYNQNTNGYVGYLWMFCGVLQLYQILCSSFLTLFD